MFTAKNKRQFIDYQNSNYYLQQNKKRRYKKIKLLFILLLIISIGLILVILSPIAKSNPLHLKENKLSDNTFIHGPQLLFTNPHKNQTKSQINSQNPAIPATFPVDIEANIEINGLVAYAEIKQTFINPHAIALEGTYQFPLPEGSAVKQLRIKIGDTEIVGEIMENKKAKSLYLQANKQGKKASLVAQQRPNLFTNKIANIPAQSTIVVTLKFIMPIAFSNSKFNLRLPLALTPRYHPKSTTYFSDHTDNKVDSNNSTQPSKHSDKQPNKQLEENYKLSTISSSANFFRSVAPSQSSINIQLNSGVPITDIFSSSHKIKSHPLNSDQNVYLITLNKTHVISDKSFDLSWQLLASNQPKVSSFTEEIAGEYYTLLTFFPPKTEKAQVIARDIIFIIDTSGSMQGDSIKQAKKSLHLALLQLNNKDSFNIIAFDNNTELLFPVTQMASAKNINNAQQFINRVNADGGTEMYRPLSHALMMKKNEIQSKNAIRQIVFITDGAVSNEFELMQLLNNAQENFRLFTIGIGAAPNGYFMKKAAQFGRGSYVFIQNQQDVQLKMTHLMTKISQPAISNITLTLDNKVHENVEMYPKKIPDLYFNEPLQITLKSQLPITHLQLTGETASTPWNQQLIINENLSSKGISSLWAKSKIEGLLDSLIVGANKEQVESHVIATSLTHQIISPYTSFIAIEKVIKNTIDESSENQTLQAKGILSPTKKTPIQQNKKNTVQTNQSLLVAMPQTSIGWQLQFMIGIAIIVLVKTKDLIQLTKKQLNRVSGYEKHH